MQRLKPMADYIKKDRRDRYDRIYLKDMDAMHVLMPYQMPKRCDNEAVLNETIDITALNEYLAKKNAGDPDFKYTWFHVITAALAKVLILRPKMNWFISGYRMYAHRDIEISFNVKRKFEDTSEEAMAKFVADPDGGSLVEQVHSYVRDFVTAVRRGGYTEGTTDKMNVLKKLPRFLLKFFFWALRRLEYHGRYPKFLAKDDPMNCSIYISNLGSIKMSANYHHLFETGTVSFFTIIGERKLRPIFSENGTYEMRDTIDLGMTIDERIADGFYFAKSLRLLRHLLQHPELLDEDASTPVDFS